MLIYRNQCDCSKIIISLYIFFAALQFIIRNVIILICLSIYLHNKSNDKESESSQLSYRYQVIRALVQRYIESARREFEEAKRKGNVYTGTNHSDSDAFLKLI